MRHYKKTRLLKALSVLVLFCGVAIGLVAMQALIQRKADNAEPRAGANMAAAPALASSWDISIVDVSIAASEGDLAARLEMGRRFLEGRGVEKSAGDAASYFRGIISECEEISAHDKRASHVAAAYVEMARLYRNGAPEADIAANPSQAFSFLHHAASYFGDSAAQTELAKVLLNGDGVTRNTRVAAQWLLSASRKGYGPAQAILGDLLWRGGDGVKRVAGDGLGLLAIARRNAIGEDKAWVNKMFETARAEAQPTEILEANAFIVQELSASHFALTDDILINGESSGSAAVSASAMRPNPADRSMQEGAAISGTSKALSELGATPMGFPQSGSFDPEPAIEMNDATQSPVILEMYRPRSPEARIESATPMRYATISN
jgi:hypothetical protein